LGGRRRAGCYGCWETLPLWAGGALLVASSPTARAARRAAGTRGDGARGRVRARVRLPLTSLAQLLAFTTGGGLDGAPPPLPKRTDEPVTRFSSGVLMLQFALPFCCAASGGGRRAAQGAARQHRRLQLAGLPPRRAPARGLARPLVETPTSAAAASVWKPTAAALLRLSRICE